MFLLYWEVYVLRELVLICGMKICTDLVEKGFLLIVVYICILVVALIQQLLLLLSCYFVFFGMSVWGRIDKIVDIKGVFL